MANQTLPLEDRIEKVRAIALLLRGVALSDQKGILRSVEVLLTLPNDDLRWQRDFMATRAKKKQKCEHGVPSELCPECSSLR